MQNKVTIEVYGTTYHITTGEVPEYVEQLGEEIDTAVRGLMTPGYGSASLPEALVLMALTYLDAYKKSEEATDRLREQVAEYLEEASQARQELAEARIELERYNRDHQLSMEESK